MRNPIALTCRRIFAGSFIALGLASFAAQSSKAEETPRADWREQNAYTLGVQAYLYAFPWAYMPLLGGSEPQPLVCLRTDLSQPGS